jgi:hypothetical protein
MQQQKPMATAATAARRFKCTCCNDRFRSAKCLRRKYYQRLMGVAMIATRMVQMPIDQIINVVPVRNRLTATVGAMSMRRIMSAQRRSGAQRSATDEHIDKDPVAADIFHEIAKDG